VTAPVGSDDLAVREVPAEDVEQLFPVLLQAEPSERALRWSVRHLSEKAYRLDVDGALAGAATVRWAGDPCEIVELAVDERLHGRGLGRRFVAWIVGEAARRGKHAVEVGTANASLGNLAFYQKCGFRFDHVRRDYFSYYREPRVEHGIPVRDLVVFRYDLNAPPRGRG
jgi:GNAT superfamily N-acetyltransferase